MSNYQYRELKRLIEEYEQDYRTIKSASSFEYRLKSCCKDFLDSPNLPLETNYPKVFFYRKGESP